MISTKCFIIFESLLSQTNTQNIFSTSLCYFLIMINEKEIYYFHLWVKLKSTSWGFYGPVQADWRSVLNERDNTLRHPCRNDIQTSFDAISEILQPQPLFPIQPPPPDSRGYLAINQSSLGFESGLFCSCWHFPSFFLELREYLRCHSLSGDPFLPSRSTLMRSRCSRCSRRSLFLCLWLMRTHVAAVCYRFE